MSALYKLMIILTISVSVSLPSNESSIEVSRFPQEWNQFLYSKNFDPCGIGENREYEFSLLDEFSDRQIVRHRPFIPVMDREEDCRPYMENNITLLDGTAMSASYIPLEQFGDYHDNFLTTQAPMKQNIHLFWQMAHEHQIDQIVMLTEFFEEKRGELCYPYWPETPLKKMVLENGAEITLIEQRELLTELHEKIEIRKFNFHFNGQDKAITHYWYRHWPDYAAPNQDQTILTLIQTVKDDKDRLGTRCPIMVHCAAGVGRTGVFITLYHYMQRLNNGEQNFDLFNFIAYLRWQRPYMVGALSQYLFCDKVVESLQNSSFSSAGGCGFKHDEDLVDLIEPVITLSDHFFGKELPAKEDNA